MKINEINVSRINASGINVSGLNVSGTNWLPDMDLNHDKQIQNLLCYRYTIGQAGARETLS